MNSKEALERLLKYNNHYIKDKEYLFIDVESEEWKAILKDLEQKEYADRINADLLETINCIKKYAMIKKTKGLGSEVIVSFHSSDKDFEKVGWVFDIIK